MEYGDGENIKRVKEEGVHNFLEFDGQILLSTIMPDRLLTEETFNFTVGFYKERRLQWGDWVGYARLRRVLQGFEFIQSDRGHAPNDEVC